MKQSSRSRYGLYASPLVLATAMGCGGAGEGTNVDQAIQAVTSGGMTASITITNQSSTAWYGTLVVANQGTTPATNWQVGLAMGQAVLGSVQSNVQYLNINGQSVVVPRPGSASLSPGASMSVTLLGTRPSGSTSVPVIATVDGDAPGTVGNPGMGWPSDGIDHVARAAATGALDVAAAYVNNKLPNNGDANYDSYDNFVWSSQAYVISAGKIAFDPNLPGYAFIPDAAKAALSAIQDAPEVASYLTAGLASCFADTKSNWIYSFRAGVLKSIQNGTTTTGTLTGQIVPESQYRPSGYNPLNVFNDYVTVGLQNGGMVVNVTLTSRVSTPDVWFGLLTYTDLTKYPNTTAVAAKFNSQGQTAACSPFNGPGGSANPYFAIALNGQSIPARFQGVGAQCYQRCTSTMVIDPIPYTEPGAYYDMYGTLVGTQSNPFDLDPARLYATPDHANQWARHTINSALQMGTFSSYQSLLKQYKYAGP